MNQGDTLICIKDFIETQGRYTGKMRNHTFIKGNKYKVTFIQGKFGRRLATLEGNDSLSNIDEIHNPQAFNIKTGGYFITLEDWRDKQLNNLI